MVGPGHITDGLVHGSQPALPLPSISEGLEHDPIQWGPECEVILGAPYHTHGGLGGGGAGRFGFYWGDPCVSTLLF